MAILKYLDLSTAHMTEADSKLLTDEFACPFRVLSDEYSFFIYILEDIDREQIKELGMSDDFINLYFYAKTKGMYSINLDRDGDIIDGLHVNNW